MPAVPSAESGRVADPGYTGATAMLSATVPRRRQVARYTATAARAAIRRIQALMLDHGITVSELGAAYALHRISELCGDAAAQPPPRHEVQITHCPSVGHDPRYQLPPGARVAEPFTAEWNRLRGGGR